MRWDDEFSRIIPDAESKLMGINRATGLPGHVLSGDLKAYLTSGVWHGVATPGSLASASLGAPISYLAAQAGSYTEFLDATSQPLVVEPGELALLYYDGNASFVFWRKEVLSVDLVYTMWEQLPAHTGESLADFVAWLENLYVNEAAAVQAAAEALASEQAAATSAANALASEQAAGQSEAAALASAQDAAASEASALASKNVAASSAAVAFASEQAAATSETKALASELAAAGSEQAAAASAQAAAVSQASALASKNVATSSAAAALASEQAAAASETHALASEQAAASSQASALASKIAAAGSAAAALASEQAAANTLAAKADHGYESNPKTLKEVDDNLVQLAGDVSELNKPIATYTYNLNPEKTITSIDIATGTFTSAAHGLTNGQMVSFAKNSTTLDARNPLYFLPSGMSISLYYVVNADGNTFQLSTTLGGEPLAITANATMDLSKVHLEVVSAKAVTIAGLPLSSSYKANLKLNCTQNINAGIQFKPLSYRQAARWFSSSGRTLFGGIGFTDITTSEAVNYAAIKSEFTLIGGNKNIRASGLSTTYTEPSMSISQMIDIMLSDVVPSSTADITSIAVSSTAQTFYILNGSTIEVYKL